MRLLVLLLALALAGCADDPAPAAGAPREPTVPTAIEAMRPAQRYEVTLAAESYHLAPPTGRASLDVDVPNDTLRAVVVVRFLSGAGTQFGLALAGCSFDAPVVPGDGRNVTVDCGALGPGAQTLELRLGAGTLDGDATVTALVCSPRPGSCQG